MGLNPIESSENIINKYLRYIETTFYIDDKEYMSEFKKFIKKKYYFAKGPYLDFSDSFEFGRSIAELVDEGIMSKEFRKLFSSNGNQKIYERKLYKHQELSIRKIAEDRNLVVTTGTGSGKTESFLLPIINHLMDQKDAGVLNDGVRALLIYPMNALANDQLKRMRELFKEYPSITFGAYTGETETKDKNALAKYASLNGGEKPIDNEKISRDQMKKNPPHILITNYAMLEYLLLRPSDNVFFHGDKAKYWKYIVLDEAHTYTGATGIEVSMLLRRLKNVLQNKESIRFILTSATLGDESDNKDICDFASKLCTGAEFNTESIVRAFRYKDFESSDSKSYPHFIYSKFDELIGQNKPVESFENVINGSDLEFKCKTESVSEWLYEFLIQDELYCRMRRVLTKGPATIKEVSKELNISENEIVSFVSVARKAEKNNIMLLDARYHMFLRALEGAYVTLGENKNLSISPRDKAFINGEEFKSYKISVCQYCGQVYIEGKIDETTSKLIQKKEDENKGVNKYYLLLKYDQYEMLSDDEKDDIYTLCGKCGYLEKTNILNSSMCRCGQQHIVKVLELVSKNKVLNKCSTCGLINTQGSVLRGFYLGQEAAASVIGSSLYEEIPSQHVEINNIELEIDDDFFGIDISDSTLKQETVSKLNKQLLVFSDSRQEAAYFASYFDFTYNNILRRRLFIEALRELSVSSNSNSIDIESAVKKLAILYELHSVTDTNNSTREAWKTVLYEISSNDRNSLENIGLVYFEFQAIAVKQLGKIVGQDAITAQRVLANSFKRDCMFDFPYLKEMQNEDKEYYSYKGIESTMSLRLTKDENKRSYRKAWIPESGINARANYLSKILNTNIVTEVNKYLEQIWNGILLKNEIIVPKSSNQYVMDISKFKIRTSFNNEIDWFICNKCRKLTAHNIDNLCPANRCTGELVFCDFKKDFPNNHYREQYLNLDIYPMKIKEHTAQLSPETAKKYQEMFIKNEINVLSCSTTFEMGVDVGELETVFMKNMPPTPANYAQRAGRAGRRKDSVAYSLTFCRLSSHDLTYFKSPTRMIKGRIYPPKFKVENVKIVKRHMNAAIIASFWKLDQDTYKDVGTFFDKENFKTLVRYIKDLPNEVVNYINDFVPVKLKALVNQWLQELSLDDGVLMREYHLYMAEIQELDKLRADAVKKLIIREDLGNYIRKIDLYTNKLKTENILSFLSKKNVIPKYGFPVDTVELVTSFDKLAISSTYSKPSKLRLQRDLMIAISEYAPGSEVIADGDIYKSQYIKKPSGQNKVWDLYDFGVCQNKKCGHLNIERHRFESDNKYLGNCLICGEAVKKENTFIIPEYGFIISPQINKSTTKKPERTFRGEIFYVGDKNEIIENNNFDIKINNTLIRIKSTSNDELVVINTSNFYVCNACGYSEVNEKLDDVNFVIKDEFHKTPYGRNCINKKLMRRTLGHKFKTDVAYISVSDYLEKERALSVLYALLEGVSQYLGIERNDISGTIHYNRIESGNWESNFILFDTVPGGAGHVRRIGKANNTEIENMFRNSLDIVQQCTCGEDSNGDSACYSCLCNYYNQKHHDIIKRKYAIEFFESLLY